jgi:hypothetical protein
MAAMSDPVTCEACGKLGYRKLSRIAPIDWWFAQLTYDESGDHDPGDRLIVSVCSPECRDGLWARQLDQRLDTLDRGIVVENEIRRAAYHQTLRLRADAKRMAHGPAASQRFARMLEEAATELEAAVEREVEYLSAEQGNAGAGGA